MKSTRIIGAAIAGGAVMFGWGAVSHMALPLGDAGFSQLSAEEELLEQMKTSVSAPGLYFFPYIDMKSATEAQTNEWMEKVRTGPSGLLVCKPSGGECMSPRMLGTEFASNALGALLAAIILSRVRGSRFTKSLLAAGMGALAWLSIDASYWNWYGFPNAFAGAAFIEQTVGWFLSGGAISLVLGRERPSPSDPFAMTA